MRVRLGLRLRECVGVVVGGEELGRKRLGEGRRKGGRSVRVTWRVAVNGRNNSFGFVPRSLVVADYFTFGWHVVRHHRKLLPRWLLIVLIVLLLRESE